MYDTFSPQPQAAAPAQAGPAMNAETLTDPVLILIHGATLNHRMWDPVRRHLDPRWRVVTVDLPGHGARRNETYTLAGAVETVVQAARSVAPSPVVLAGDSLGGYTCLASAASLPPSQLLGLVISGASANLSGLALIPFKARVALFKVLFFLLGEQRLLRDKVPGMLKKLHIGEADAQAMIEAGISLRAYGQAVVALQGVDFKQRLAAIAHPVLLVNGTQDFSMMAQEAKFLAVAQRARSQHFDCRHGVSLLRSAEFADSVNTFVRDIASASSR